LCYLQAALNRFYSRVRATKHAPRGPFRLPERRHGLAQIVKRGARVIVKRGRVIAPYPEHDLITISENASRHWYRFKKL
jgi:hypothetical protein